MNALKAIPTYHHLQPAVVTNVLEQSAQVSLKNGDSVTILWDGMSWAREYLSDQKQGVPAPKTAAEILKIGDVIWTTNLRDSYQLSQLPRASSALVAMNPDNGAIQAVVGGFSFKQSQFNRVTQAKRQVGSNIKPFIYSAALENDFTLASLVNDAPINQWDKNIRLYLATKEFSADL